MKLLSTGTNVVLNGQTSLHSTIDPVTDKFTKVTYTNSPRTRGVNYTIKTTSNVYVLVGVFDQRSTKCFLRDVSQTGHLQRRDLCLRPTEQRMAPVRNGVDGV